MYRKKIKMNNMNILHVVNIYFTIPYFLGDQLDYFRDKGYNMHIICSPSKELIDFAHKKRIKYKQISILRKISLISDFKAVIAICKYIKSNRINIVNGHTPKGGIVAMTAAFIMGVPNRIYFRHGLVYETSSGLKRKLLIMIDRIASLLSTKIICVSPSVCQRSLEDKLNPSNKQQILANGTCNGIDTVRFDRDRLDNNTLLNLRTKFNINENDFIIGFTGRLVKDKGIIELIESFKLLSYKYNNIKLLLVGMLEVRDGLPTDIIKIIKENHNIITTGYINNSQIENYYGIMDLFILPSYREGFPTSVLEASSMKLPVITTKVTGCIDSILDGKTGLFTTHNSNDIANNIEKFILNNNLQQECGKNGREFVVNKFAQNLVWREIEKLYI